MPSFQNPVPDADEAREAMRGLAYATRHIEHAEDTYPVLGDLTRTVEGLQQVLIQLAAWHSAHQSRAATDAGDHAVGAADAMAAAGALTSAASALDEVWESVNAAWSRNGAIAWQPHAPTPDPVVSAPSRPVTATSPRRTITGATPEGGGHEVSL